MTAPGCRTLFGIDYGRRRIGIAVGQELTASARPLTTLRNGPDGPDWRTLAALIDEWRPQLLILGLPRHADGSDNSVSVAVRAFRDELERRFDLPLAAVDERLSSAAAAERLAASGRRYRRDDIDAAAAALILESYLHEASRGGN